MRLTSIYEMRIYSKDVDHFHAALREMSKQMDPDGDGTQFCYACVPGAGGAYFSIQFRRDGPEPVKRIAQVSRALKPVRVTCSHVRDEFDPDQQPALEWDENDEYTMKARTAWITVNTISVYLRQTAEGVTVELYPYPNTLGGMLPIATAEAAFKQ